MPGWLRATTGPAQLVQTEELTAGQLRLIEDNRPANIRWTPLSLDASLVSKPVKGLEDKSRPFGAFSDKPGSSPLVITNDPHFIAQQWLPYFDLQLPITSTTSSSDLLELISLVKPEDSKKGLFWSGSKEISCKYQLQPLAKALLAGKKVLLYGQLPYELYLALEPVKEY